MSLFMTVQKKLINRGLIILFAAAPVTVDTTSFVPYVTEQTAYAKNGTDRGNGGNNNGRSDNGRGDNIRGDRGNDAKGKGNESKNGNGKTPSKKEPASKPASKANAPQESIEIRHTNGITETLWGGRYVMKDARGRTIINRRATSADIRRLGRYAHR
ncbi:hypothetical protein [Pararhizobium arenae]|uniref:hypothetical protein n=1 Tax=Pararhizobium arenae TaxID=1856850 RepID=UPI0009F8FC87|nr:hypothetical protein [Pararhizobium arenae]